MIANLPMFIDLQAAFTMLSLYYAQQPNYLQDIIFPSPSILQCYTEFDAHTITMLKKLLRLGLGFGVEH